MAFASITFLSINAYAKATTQKLGIRPSAESI
jgi:hypothetical protein